MIVESIFTEVTVTGITVYGMALLFIKALLILLLAQVLADSFEFSPASIRHTVWLIALASLAAVTAAQESGRKYIAIASKLLAEGNT